MQYLFWGITFSILFVACKTYKPEFSYKDNPYIPVDYSKIENWAAHPDKEDEADKMPEGGNSNNKNLPADVFFIHPTTYTGEKNQDQWNANIDDVKLNRKTDEGTIRFQASAFNQAGRIFAPRYRQAHIYAYFTKDKVSAKKAFDLAYEDIKAAFLLYLKIYNNNRPIIVAGHSQGTNHAERLLEEFFSDTPLKKSLITAYLVGMPVRKDRFTHILPCKDSTDIGCFVSWRTFKSGYSPTEDKKDGSIAVTNPLSWTNGSMYMDKSLNKGTLLYKFNKIIPSLVDAQVHNNILWANKPKFMGSVFLRTKNYHIADINFYYMNIRQNAKQRMMHFLSYYTE